MKIIEVRAVPLGIPARAATPPSPWTAGTAKQVLVRVVTDSGLAGWGECFAYGAPLAVVNVVDEALAPLLVGEDPTAIERLTDKMHRALMIWGRRGLGMFGVSGVELALWDLCGKARDVPVWALLGGLAQPRVRAYASLLRYESATDVGRAARAIVAQGFTAMKLHQTDVESVAVVREAVGDRVDVMLDTNCPWTVEQAIRIGRELERYDLRWLEEPVWPPEDYAGLARVRAAVSIPIATGENDMTMFGHAAILAAGAADIVQPSVTKVGGLGEMRKIATLAAAAGVTFVPHSYYFGPGLAATLHLCAATPGVPYIEFPPGELEAPLTAEPIRCVDGWVAVGDRPGLGADPDPDVIQRYPYSGEKAKPFYL
ncbi:MAG: mandelate racemase/muconate lactonizing enzyme family protein [Candidatus Rokubacteria bacterium]|nr:mandelate racemase/muconate lactonizing enzyme family protein [Candidatus Rokubacteria bacterium]